MKDKQILEALRFEQNRPLHNVEFIALENYVSNDVLEVVRSILTNKFPICFN